MLRTIYKYPLNSAVNYLPQGAKVLSFQVQHGVPCVWALVDPNAQLVQRKLKVFGTGQPIHVDTTTAFVGTIQDDGFVWHLFDFGEEDGN